MLTEVGARLYLAGKIAYITGLSEATAATKKFEDATHRASQVGDEASASSKKVTAARNQLSEATVVAKNRAKDYETAVKAEAVAEVAAAKASTAAREASLRARSRAELDAARLEDQAAQQTLTAARARTQAAMRAREAADDQVTSARRLVQESKYSADQQVKQQKRIQAAYNSTASTARAVMLGTAAVAGIATYASVKMAGDFEAATIRLVTGANESVENLSMVRAGLLDLAGELGVGAVELSEALYTINSAAYHGEAGLAVLRSAIQGAKADGSDTRVVVDALSSALRDYYPAAKSAADVTFASGEVMSKLIATTNVGKMSFEELASSLHSILPVASAAKIPLEDILGALASMTVHGYSAQQATQNLAHAVLHLERMTAPQMKTITMLGLSYQDLMEGLGERGLTGTVKLIDEAIQRHMGPGSVRVIMNLRTALAKLPPEAQALATELIQGSISWYDYYKTARKLPPVIQGQAMSFATLAKSTHQIGNETKSAAEVLGTYAGVLRDAMGDQTGMNVALQLGGKNAGYTSYAVGEIGKAHADASGKVQGFALVQETFNQKLDEMTATAKSAGIEFGYGFLPVMKDIVDLLKIASGVVSEHTTATRVVTLAIFAAITLYGIYKATVILASAAQAAMTITTAILTGEFWALNAAMAANPIGLLVVGIVIAAALIAGAAYLIWKNWDKISGFFSGLWEGVKGAFSSARDWIGDLVGDIVEFVSSLPGRLGRIAGRVGSAFLDAIETGFQGVVWFFANLPYLIGYALGFLVGWLFKTGRDAGEAFTNAIIDGFHATVDFVQSIPRRIRGLLVRMIVWMHTDGRRIIGGLRDGVVDGFWAVVDWFHSLPGRFMRFMRGAGRWLRDAGWDAIQGLGNGVRDALQWLSEDMPRQALNLGQNIVDGFIDGIWNMLTFLWRVITDFVKGFIDGVKRGMGVASPSTVMYDIAMWVITGFINGIWAFAGGIKDAFSYIWNEAKGIFIRGANAVIDIVNGFLGVVNKIAGAVGFSINLHIEHIPHKMAKGGVIPVRYMAEGGAIDFGQVGGGFITRGPRAIVGEGNPAHPEYVIPTDPSHRDRALGLFSDLAEFLLGHGAATAPRYERGGVPRYEEGGVLSGVWGGITKGAKAVGSAVRSAADWMGEVAAKGIRKVIEAQWPVLDMPHNSMAAFVPGLMNKLRTNALDWIDSKYAPVIPGGRAAPAQVHAWVMQALGLMGMGPQFAPGIEHLIMKESGGNPHAINLWDSNARAGHPSQGLMQTIPSTYRAYVLPSLSHRPITDPVANITAGVRYAMSRYGPQMLMAGGRKGAGGGYIGYATGGVLPSMAAAFGIPTREIGGAIEAGQPYLVGENGPEIVVPAAPGVVIPNLAGSGGGGAQGETGPIKVKGGTVNLGPVYISEVRDPKKTYDEVRRAVSDAAARM